MTFQSDLVQYNMIYTPQEDSFMLEGLIKKYAKNKKFLDMGTGSGIQAKAAISSGAKSVLASDINEIALRELKKQNIQTIKSNLFSNIKEKFDLIAFNPPYLPRDKREDSESEVINSGGKRGDEIILKFLKQVPLHLNKDGIILLVISSLTPKDKILNILEKENLEYKSLISKSFFFETLEVWLIQLKNKQI